MKDTIIRIAPDGEITITSTGDVVDGSGHARTFTELVEKVGLGKEYVEAEIEARRGSSFGAAPSTSRSFGCSAPAPDGCVLDAANGLMWSRDDVVSERCNQATAEKACQDLRLGGFDDWRLPTRKELLTLVDDTRHEPAIDVDRFPSCKSAWYWTSTPCAWSSDYAWLVGFNSGNSDLVLRDFNVAFARAVRSVPAGQ